MGIVLVFFVTDFMFGHHVIKKTSPEIICLVRTQNGPRIKHFLPSDTHVHILRGKRYYFFEKPCVHTEWMIRKEKGGNVICNKKYSLRAEICTKK